MPLTIEYVHGHRVELVGADGTTIISAVRLIHPGHQNRRISAVAHQVSLDTAKEDERRLFKKQSFSTAATVAPHRTYPVQCKCHVIASITSRWRAKKVQQPSQSSQRALHSPWMTGRRGENRWEKKEDEVGMEMETGSTYLIPPRVTS